jgi:hypothetical protein
MVSQIIQINQTSLKSPKRELQELLQTLPQGTKLEDAPPKVMALLALEALKTLTMAENWGFSPEASETYVETLLEDLEEYPARDVFLFFDKWRKTSTKKPTTADAVGYIKRNGKPPLRESDIIAIRKKDGADKTPDDWQMLREWEAQQSEGWDDAPSTNQASANQAQEITALRRKVAQLEAQLAGNRTEQATTNQVDICIATIKAKLEKPLEEKIQSTVDMMRRQGCTEEDVLEFIASIS